MSAEAVREATPFERDQQKQRKEAAGELEVMRVAFSALHKLSPSGQIRALDWLHSALRDVRSEEVPF